MLIRDLQEIIKNAPKWANIDIDDVYFDGLDFICVSTELEERIEELEEDIKINEKVIKEQDERSVNEGQYANHLQKQIDEYEQYFSNLKDNKGKSFRELLERNQWQEKELVKYEGYLKTWRDKVTELEKEITNLRARKNKATVKRCLTTGQLMAEFNGVEYILTKK
jgi:chromosome segregation ATPase